MFLMREHTVLSRYVTTGGATTPYHTVTARGGQQAIALPHHATALLGHTAPTNSKPNLGKELREQFKINEDNLFEDGKGEKRNCYRQLS